MEVGQYKFGKFGGYMNSEGASLLFSERDFYAPSILLIFNVIVLQIP